MGAWVDGLNRHIWMLLNGGEFCYTVIMTASTNDILMGLREVRKAIASGGYDKVLQRLRRQAMSGDIKERQVALASMGYMLRNTRSGYRRR